MLFDEMTVAPVGFVSELLASFQSPHPSWHTQTLSQSTNAQRVDSSFVAQCPRVGKWRRHLHSRFSVLTQAR